ncbi:alkaline-phosphatase-like protein [Scenedesmus sp. NREL 46B-D3]|nr:alkaline-phosphatase-like protein [Scenedesmus sp. NREL 46B-D3]
MAVSGGWDFINREEVTVGEALAAGGYRTAHFGKWHNQQVLGYEPWHSGFEDGYIPPSAASGGEGLARVNGRYVVAQEEGNVFDKLLCNQTIEYLQQRKKDGQPFFVFWAARSIHTNYVLPDLVTGEPKERRIVPAQYRDKFYGPAYIGVAASTKDAWAFMEYLDDSLGPMFDFLASSALDQSTYILFTSDNGPAVYADEKPPEMKLIRMPSGMAGAKHSVLEGGIRNYLTVQGPGVKPGASDSTMLAISDLFPTLVDIAGVGATVPRGLPLDGISFKSVLLPNSIRNTGIGGSDSRPAAGGAAAGAGSAVQQQTSLVWRYFFMLAPDCWGPNAVPELGPDR